MDVSARSIDDTQDQVGLRGQRPWRKTLLKERHKKAREMFSKTLIDKPQSFWENVLWMESKVELFDNAVFHFVYRQGNKANEEKNLLPTEKHGQVLSGCGTAVLSLALVEETLNGTECIKGMMRRSSRRNSVYRALLSAQI